jgi:tetratricopeptide (TPR) repeat protein
VVRAAAVLGPEVDYEPLAEIVHVDEDELAAALDHAVSAGLLVESGRSWAGSYAFPHELTREAIRGDLTGPRRRRLHAQSARALMSQIRVGSGTSAEVAAHLREAGSAAEPLEAADWSLRAAQEARAVCAWDEAIQHADVAVDLLEGRASDERIAQAAVVAANLRLRSSRGFGQAVTLLETALRRYVAAGMDSAAGAVHSRLGGALSLHHSVMDIPRALDHFDAAERLLGESEGAFHVSRGRSQAAMFGLRTGILAAAADRAAATASEAGRRDLAAFAGWAQGWAALNEGRLADAAGHLEHSWATAHELSDPYLGWAPVNAAALMANAYLLDPATARRWCRRGLGQPRFTTLAHSHDTVVDQLALALAATGDLTAAREALSSLRPDAVARRMMTFLDGDWEEARDAWADAIAADEAAGDLHDAALNWGWLAVARRALGDRDGAVAAWERALDLGRLGPQVPTELAARAELARLCAAEDVATAAGHLHRCDEILAADEDWRGAAGRVELARAEVAEARGDHELADTCHARAVEVFAAFDLPWHRADALRSGARRLAGRGLGEQADKERRQADQLLRDIGASDRWWRPGGPT